MGIQRWIQAQGDSEFEMWRDPKGPYVLFSDHEAELQAQRAVLAGPIDVVDWNSDLHVFRTVGRGGAMDRLDINDFLAARAAKLDKKPEPTLKAIKDLLYDPKDGPSKIGRNDAVVEAYERGRKAVQP